MTGGITDAIKAVDQTFLFVFLIAGILFIIISITMVIILVRYNYRRNPKAASFKGSIPAEIIWITVPSLIVIAMFISGWESYLVLRTPPKNVMRVDVTARQWSYTFTYQNKRISNMLYVPENKPVLLSMQSADVLHSFYAPAFRIKRDIVPGMTATLWFVGEKIGEFDVMCTQYCGLGHSSMHTKIIVLPQNEFDRWYQGGQPIAGTEDGREIFIAYGCIGCHTLGGAVSVGPPLEDIYEKTTAVTTKEAERTIIVDKEYLRRSILDPNEEIVKGYQPIMPSFKGKISEKELAQLLLFIEALSASEDGKSEAPDLKIMELDK